MRTLFVVACIAFFAALVVDFPVLATQPHTVADIRVKTQTRKGVLTARSRTSDANPPMFNWRPTAEKYRLQYATDAKFPPKKTTTVEVRTNFYTPAKPLQSGTWYWRVWRSPDSIERWSDIERIVLLPDAVRFTTPAVPVKKIAALPRPRLLSLVKLEEPQMTKQYAARLVSVAKKSYDEGVPQHPGPYVPGDSRWPTWIEWYGSVGGGVTSRMGHRLQNIGKAAMLTRDPQVIGWAKERALEACAWDPEGGSAKRYHDIAAHHLLRGLNMCYDACYDQMTPSERQTIKGIIIQRAEQFYHDLNPFRRGEANNHVWLQTLGLAESGVVLMGEHDAAAQWTEYSRQLYVGRILACLGQQGDNNEGVAYWSFGLGFIIDYADLTRLTCGINLYAHPWLNRTARFPMYCAPPNAWAVSFADSGMPNHGIRGPAGVDSVRKLAVRTRDPYALWYAGDRSPVDGLTPKPPVDLAPSIHYRHIGLVIFNTSLIDGREGATVAMHSGLYQAGHQQADQNSFVVNAYGEKLAIDGGYYDWYGSPHFKEYSTTTLAHNTLLVDDQGQAVHKHGADGRIKTYFDSKHYGYTVGDASNPEIYGGRLRQFDRRILFIKPGFVIVHDLVASAKQAARYDWLLHAIVPIEVDSAQKSFLIPCKRAALRGRFIWPADVTLDVKTGFPVEPVDRYSTRPVPRDKYFPEWILHAVPRQNAVSQEFVSAMQIQMLGDKREPEARIESESAENAWAIRCVCGESTHLILLRKPEAVGTIRCGDLSTDGEAAAVELSDGKIRRAFVAGATFLRRGEQTVFQSPRLTDWALP